MLIKSLFCCIPVLTFGMVIITTSCKTSQKSSTVQEANMAQPNTQVTNQNKFIGQSSANYLSFSGALADLNKDVKPVPACGKAGSTGLFEMTSRRDPGGQIKTTLRFAYESGIAYWDLIEFTQTQNLIQIKWHKPGNNDYILQAFYKFGPSGLTMASLEGDVVIDDQNYATSGLSQLRRLLQRFNNRTAQTEDCTRQMGAQWPKIQKVIITLNQALGGHHSSDGNPHIVQ